MTLVLLLAACASRQADLAVEPAAPRISGVVISGNTAFDDETLLDAVAVDPDEEQILDGAVLGRDQERLLSFYRRHGFFEAEVPPFLILTGPVAPEDVPPIAPPVPPATVLPLDEPVPGPSPGFELGVPPPEDLLVEGTPSPPPDDPPAPPPVPDLDTGELHVVMRIWEGPRYAVSDTSVEVDGELPPEGLDLAGEIDLAAGDPWAFEPLEQARLRMRERLRQAGFPFAEVHLQTAIAPERDEARVRFLATTGPRARLGDVVVLGAEGPLADRVADRVRQAVPEGQLYDPRLIDLAARQAAAVPLVEDATVAPGGYGEVVDVVVTAVPEPRQRYEVGASFAQDSDWHEFAVRGRALRTWSLARLELDAAAGWVFAPTLFDLRAWSPVDIDRLGRVDPPGRNGPLLEAGARLVHPAALADLGAEARVVLGQDQTWGFVSPRASLSASRAIARNSRVAAAMGVEVWLPTPDEVSRTLFDTGLPGPGGEVVPVGGVVPYLEQSALHDRRDDVLWPKRGRYLALTLREALPPRPYLAIQPEARGYLPVADGRLVLAGRVSAAAIAPLAHPGAPAVSRLWLGGGSSYRGAGRSDLTWYSGPGCPAPTTQVDASSGCTVPIGGDLSALASLELRAPVADSATVVAFTDAAQVALTPLSGGASWPSPADTNVAVGAGVRWRSPFGPLRADFAVEVFRPVRYDDGQAFLGGCPCALQLAIGEAF